MVDVSIAAGALKLEETDGVPADELRRARARDALVWAAWHDRYYPFVYRYAYSRLRNQQEAEDVASEVFLEAIKSIGRYRDRGRPVLAWFYGIARNVVSHRYRELARSTPFSYAPVDCEELAVGTQGEPNVDRIVLTMALEQLKAQQREVLLLRFLMDLPTRQVAAMIGKSESATYSLQVRALAALQRLMTEEKSEKSADGRMIVAGSRHKHSKVSEIV